MVLKRLLFPVESRFFPGQRWANISLRTLHLIGVAGLGGGFLYPAEGEGWRLFLDLTIASGVGNGMRSIGCRVAFSIARNRRSSRGAINKIASPARPARPVRPMR